MLFVFQNSSAPSAEDVDPEVKLCFYRCLGVKHQTNSIKSEQTNLHCNSLNFTFNSNMDDIIDSNCYAMSHVYVDLRCISKGPDLHI